MTNIDKIEDYCNAIAHQLAKIDVKDISFSQEVVAACEQNSCGRYNKMWLCPPAIPQELIERCKRFNKAIVYTTRHILEDSFDYEGMMAASSEHSSYDRVIKSMITGDDCMILGSSSCNQCDKCSYPERECRHPQSLIYSVESMSIDVVALSQSCNIRYNNGKNTVTYFSVILYN